MKLRKRRKPGKSTGNQKVDDILRGTIGIYEILFPDQVRGVYLLGSSANRSALPTSDIDVIIVCKGDFVESPLKTKIWQICQQSALICPMRLDIKCYGERELSHIGSYSDSSEPFMKAVKDFNAVITKIASLLIYGEDIRDKIRLSSIDAFQRDMTYFTSCWFSGIRQGPQFLTFPLSYPNPEDRFYGYAVNNGVASRRKSKT